MSTGENDTGLRKIADMTRLMSIFILFLHFYYSCYTAFLAWQLTTPLTNRLLTNIANTGLFRHFNDAKWIALGLLSVSLLGAKGKKDEKKKSAHSIYWIVMGAFFYFIGQAFFTLIAPSKYWQPDI